MQYRPFFRYVDLFAAKHRLYSLPQTGFLGELDQQFHRFFRDAVLGVIQENTRGFENESLATFSVRSKEVPEMRSNHVLAVGLEGDPRVKCG